MADKIFPNLSTKSVDGALLVAAIVDRGMSLRALKHIHNTLRGTVWHYIATGLTGCTNGNGGDSLDIALRGIRTAGLSVDETRRAIIAEISKLSHNVDAWLENDPVVQGRKKIARGRYDNLSDLDEVDWLWPGWIPKRYLSMIAGESGMGKTSMALWLATVLLKGGSMPDGTHIPERECADADAHPKQCGCPSFLWIDTESAEPLLRKRMRAYGTPGEQIVHCMDDEDYGMFDLTKPKWQDRIEGLIHDDNVQCVFMDSLRGSHSGKESDEEMHPVLKWCADLARDVHIGFLNTHHLRKTGPGEAREVYMDRVRGSTHIVAMHRVIIALDQPDPMLDRRMRVIKSNLDVMPEGSGYQLQPDGVIITDMPSAPKLNTATDSAIAFLQGYLTEPKHAAEVKHEANMMAIGTPTLERAKSILGVKSERRAGVWWWCLPWNKPPEEETKEHKPF